MGFCSGGFRVGSPPAWLLRSFAALVPGRRPARGGGEGGRVSGGRSNADAKVAASGHHFCARKLNPGLKVAAAPVAGAPRSFPPPPLRIIPNMFRYWDCNERLLRPFSADDLLLPRNKKDDSVLWEWVFSPHHSLG